MVLTVRVFDCHLFPAWMGNGSLRCSAQTSISDALTEYRIQFITSTEGTAILADVIQRYFRDFEALKR